MTCEGTLRLTEIRTVAASGNSVACVLRWTAAQPVGRVLDVENIDVYTVENGRITKVVVFTADAKREDEFWGK